MEAKKTKCAACGLMVEAAEGTCPVCGQNMQQRRMNGPTKKGMAQGAVEVAVEVAAELVVATLGELL